VTITARRYRRSENWLTIHVPKALVMQLAPHADRRRITVPELARRILECTVDNQIVDAVLDDLEDA